MNIDTLKSCPFCGGEIKQMFLNNETCEDAVYDESIGNASTWFKCYGCDSEFFHDEPIDTPEKQAEWWNTRKPIERIVEQLEEYKYSKENLYVGKVVAAIIGYAIEIVKEESGLK